MRFEELVIDEPLRRALSAQGFDNPTRIQQQAIPPALDRRDVMGTAQTGTGKTLAFLLPSFQHLLSAKHSTHPRMVVLAPTRELALQIAGDATKLAQFTRLRVAAIYGGAPIGLQAQALRRGLDLVVATPGRLMDHMQRGNIRLDDVMILVLDEADRMLDMGFLPDIEAIVARLPQNRQTLLFSATMAPAMVALGYRFLKNAVRVDIETARPPEAICQQFYPVAKHLKTRLLVELMKQDGVERALVFTRTKQEADFVSRKLKEARLSVAEIHGDFNQKDRIRALEGFRSGAARILVATNVAARGLDIDDVSHVVNFDVPDEAEDYVHRIGRTARLEAEGVAWTLVMPEDEPLIAAIEYLLEKKIERVRLTGFDYDVPAPDWAKPSAKTMMQNVRRTQTSFDRWKSLTR
jgi:ATP-dependent RNA helicase RhlE